MSKVLPFAAYRPNKDVVSEVAALPYDVYKRAEAAEFVKDHPQSFLRIDRPETQFSPDQDMYAQEVYDKAAEMLKDDMSNGTYIHDEEPFYYIYELIMDGRHQTGIVAVVSIDDYLEGTIKKHENTLAAKEQDRINHIYNCNAQTGPIFLAYRDRNVINDIVNKVKQGEKTYGFTAEDGITHNVWLIEDAADIAAVKAEFDAEDRIYIADGHHRAASAVKVGLKKREENPGYTGDEDFNFFMSVLFPESELKILPYNRVIKDLNGLSEDEFIQKLSTVCDVCMNTISAEAGDDTAQFEPMKKGEIGMYLGDIWYKLTIKDEFKSEDPVDGLDVSILQDNVLGPILGIEDPRTDKRIDFVGGIRGLGELERRANSDMKLAFSMYPTSINELFEVADAGLLMPPKSTWFEPKLRSGIFIHTI
ncbi:Uncharacterized conserved protein, DUF1015 family [Lachnospiraceae bacterium NE2001]|nr:Uncharacterized conserved protein, DUF1015 family [Lachnospiraceae bacterium NE2001]